MSNSPLLQIPQIAENQSNKYVTHDNAIDALEKASNASMSDATTGSVTLTIAQAHENMVFRMSGKSAAFDVTFPSYADAPTNAVQAKRVFVLRNEDTTYVATVKASSGAGSTVAVQPGTAALILQTFEDMRVLVVSSNAGTTPYDLGFFVPGKPDAGGQVMKYTAVRAVTIAGNAAGSRGHISTNPTATMTFDVQKNGVSTGSISISTGGAFTFTTTSGDPISLAAGDRLQVFAPNPQDATGSDVSVSFLGSRVI